MTSLKTTAGATLAACALLAGTAGAEDIDLFQGGSSITGSKPNVLIVLDNSANWNSSSQHWPGGIKQGQSELNAMATVLSALTSDVRVGVEFFVKGATSDDHGLDGGYLRFGVRDMSSTNRTAVSSILLGIYPDFNNENTGQQVATANTDYGAGMYEAYRYFSGYTKYSALAPLRDYSGNGSYNVSPYKAGNLSGNALANSSATTAYTSPLSTDNSCGKNYIIFIGNGFPRTTSVNPTTLVNFTVPSGVTAVTANGKTPYSDIWAYYLKNYGVNAPCATDASGNQYCANGKVITYTIDVYKDAQDTNETSLLKNMAALGGGKYFAATSESAIKTALSAIFNEIQSVNSVFTSASLPVSVNTQGTYLNQIYMGVFRPDGGGKPRWLGNLKEYKFSLTTDAIGNKTIVLADADDLSAVNSDTGFITSTARSYWTSCPTNMAFNSTSHQCESTGGVAGSGFWSFNAQGIGGQYDAPDGDLVEKGAAAQKLRSLGPSARNIYTCEPSCNTNASPSTFDTTNPDTVAGVAASSAVFGSGSSVTLTRSGTTVTGTTSSSLGLGSPTDIVSISGSSVSDYNSVWDVTTDSSTTFHFTVAETPITPATGTITVAASTPVSQTIQTSPNSGYVTYSNGVVTVQLASHGLSNGQQATISGANVSSGMSQSTSTQTISGPTELTATCAAGATRSASGTRCTTSAAGTTTTSPTTTTTGTVSTSTSTTTTGPTTTTDSNSNTSQVTTTAVTTTTTTPKTDTYTTTTTTGSTVTTWTEETITSLFTPCTGYSSTANCEYNGTFNITYIDSDHFSYTPPTADFGSTVTTTSDVDKTQTTASGSSTTTTTTNYTRTDVSTTTTTSTTSTSWSPAKTFTTSYGNASIVCKHGSGSTTYTPSLTGITRVTTSDPTPATPAANASTSATAASTQQVTVTMSSSSMNDCSLPFIAGNSSNGNLISFAIANSASANGINGTYTFTGSSVSGGVLTVTFNVTVTATKTNVTTSSTGSTTTTCAVASGCGSATTSTSAPVASGGGTTTTSGTPRTTNATTTLVPSSPATGTVVVSAVPTRNVTSITRTAGNASNVATVTVTTSSAHGFSGQSQVTIAGADQTEYNGTKTVAANGLAFPTSTTITYNLTTGPTSPSTGSAAKGYAIDVNSLIKWVRGVDNKEDENTNASYTDARASMHGDVLHSRPLVINYGSTYGIVAFYGANDGMLHAVQVGTDESANSTNGKELWAFVAPEQYGNLPRLYNNLPLIKFPNTSATITPTPTKRDYFFDGNIGVYQSADLATTHIFVSVRRGGRFIYAFDVSNPNTPKFLWKKTYTDTGMSELGYTWSEPKVFALRKTAGVSCSATDSTTYTRALIFGAGYDPTEEDKDPGVKRTPTIGRGVFILDATNGSLIKFLQPATDSLGNANSSKKYGFPADVTLLDTDGDGCIDRVYAVDTGANIHRYDIGDSDPNQWKSYKIASLGDIGDNGGTDDRKFLFPTDAILGAVNGSQVVYLAVGSGDREQPQGTTVDDKFFLIKDTIAVGATSYTTTQYSDLSPVLDPVTNVVNHIDASDPLIKGWYLQYLSGEKSVNAPLTVGGITYFGTNQPKAADPHSCEANLGTARGYAVDFLTGAAAYDRGYYSTFAGGGLPPSPVSGVVQIGSDTVRFVIGSGGDTTTSSPIQGAKVQASPSSKRTRSFWYFKKDQ